MTVPLDKTAVNVLTGPESDTGCMVQKVEDWRNFHLFLNVALKGAGPRTVSILGHNHLKPISRMLVKFFEELEKNPTVKAAFTSPNNYLSTEEREEYERQLRLVLDAVNPLKNKSYCSEYPAWKKQDKDNKSQGK